MTSPAVFLPGLPELPRLTTPRLHLRPLGAADVPALYTVFSDPAVMRYWSRPPMTDVAEAAELQAQIVQLFEQRTLFQWGVVRTADDQLLGTATLWELSVANRRAALGYALGSAHWGQSYGGEVVAELVRFGFDDLHLYRLEADVDPRNTASRRCLIRQGFQEEGLQRARYYLYDEWQDALLFGLLRPDARPTHSA